MHVLQVKVKLNSTYHDPHCPQCIKIRPSNNILLLSGESPDEIDMSRSLLAAKIASKLRPQLINKARILHIHFVLEDDAANHDGYGRGDGPAEAHCSDDSRCVEFGGRGLGSEEGTLDVHADADTGEDLEDEQFLQVLLKLQVEEESDAESEGRLSKVHDG